MWIIIAVVLMSVFNHYSQPEIQQRDMNYSHFLDEVQHGNISSVEIQEGSGGKVIMGLTRDGQQFRVVAPGDDGLIKDLLDNNVEIKARPPEERSILIDILISLLPVLVLVGLWVYFMRQMQGGGGGRGGAMSFGKSRAKLRSAEHTSELQSRGHLVCRLL